MAPLPPDPYKILGVSKDAQVPEIRSSYRKLVLQCHPDKVQDPKLKEQKQNEFQRVQQAYELLTNEAERQKYDDKARLEDLRRQLKEKANISTPRAKYSTEFEIRTPDMRSSTFKSSPSSAKVYSFSRYDDEYAPRGTRIFETKSSRPSKRDPSVSERQSKRDAEKDRERQRDKERDRERERRRKEEDDAARRKTEKEAQKAEKRRMEKQRDRDMKREAEEKYRSRNHKASVEVFEDEVPKSERKRSSKKHDDKSARASPRDEKPDPSSRPPLTKSPYLYSPDDCLAYNAATSYMQASRGAPGLNRSYSYSTRPVYPPAAPSPPPTNSKKVYATEDSDSDEFIRRSSAPSRRGSGDGPRLSRERSAYRKSSNEVLDDNVHAVPSPATRHTSSFSRSMPMGSSPPHHDMHLPRTNSMPQPSFTRPSPGIKRAHTFAAPDMPRGRDRSRNQPQVHVEPEESDEDYGRERERDRRYRSRRTASPEPVGSSSVFRYEVDSSSRRTRPMAPPPMDADASHGHYMYGQGVRPDTRAPSNYREGSYGVAPGRYPSVKTSKYEDIQYSQYHPSYNNPVRA
ncbi:hypothetical protein ARSEF1564_000366 [Beauveria bassiana]